MYFRILILKIYDFQNWEIYKANLDPVVGSEQGKSRPVMVISENAVNQLLNTINVLPITSRKPGRTVYPNEALLKAGIAGLPNESIILCHQIRTLDKIRLTNFYGSIENSNIKQEIEEALTFQLDLGNLA